jgi:hypothetical protein
LSPWLFPRSHQMRLLASYLPQYNNAPATIQAGRHRMKKRAKFA